MKSPGLPPIPTPPAVRLRQLKTSALPMVVFLGAIVAIAALWQQRIGAPTMVGQAEGAISNVMSHQPGIVAGVRVSRFQKVHAGEQIATILLADPKLVEASLAVIRADLELLRVNLSPIADQQRNAVNFAQLRLDWMRQRADLASARVNLQLAESEFLRTQQLFKNKISSESDLDVARASMDALRKQVEELSLLVSEGGESFASLQPGNAGEISRITDEPMRAAFAAQEARLRLTEAEFSPLKLVSPLDGTVTAVHFRSGESVTPGQPIITIAADSPARVVGYLRQPARMEPKVGDTVHVRTRGVHRPVATAEILEVGSQLEELPLAMQSPLKFTATEFALPVHISLPAGLRLRPGELVDISIVPSPN